MTAPTNPYYQETFAATLGSQARSRAMEAEFRSIQRGFDLIKNSIEEFQVSDIDRFIDLLDVPSTYTNQGLKLVRVNASASGLEFVSPGGLVIKIVTGTTYTVEALDAGKMLLFTANSPVTVTVQGGTHAQGDVVYMVQWGDGQVEVVEGLSFTLRSTDNLFKTRTKYAQIALVMVGANEGNLVGERNASITGFARLVGGNDFTGSQNVQFVTLTDASSISTDAATGNHFVVTLGGNRTLANPTNLRDGQILNYWVKQDDTGGRTLAFGSAFKWPEGEVPSMTSAAGSVDLIVAHYNHVLGILACVMIPDFR